MYVNALQSGGTPLLMAAKEGHVGVARALLEAGADVDKAMEVRIAAEAYSSKIILYMTSRSWF